MALDPEGSRSYFLFSEEDCTPLSWVRVSWSLGVDISYKPIETDEIRILAPNNGTLSRAQLSSGFPLMEEAESKGNQSGANRFRSGSVMVQLPGVVGTLILCLFSTRSCRRILAMPVTLHTAKNENGRSGIEGEHSTAVAFTNIHENPPELIRLIYEQGVFHLSYRPDALQGGTLVVCRQDQGDNDNRLDCGPFGAAHSIVLETPALHEVDQVDGVHTISVLPPWDQFLHSSESSLAFHVRYLKSELCSVPRSVACSNTVELRRSDSFNPITQFDRDELLRDSNLHDIRGSIQVAPSLCYPSARLRVQWDFTQWALGSIQDSSASAASHSDDARVETLRRRLALLFYLLSPCDTIESHPCDRKDLTNLRDVSNQSCNRVYTPLLRGSQAIVAPSEPGSYDVVYHSLHVGDEFAKSITPLKVIQVFAQLDIQSICESTAENVLVDVEFAVTSNVFHPESDLIRVRAPPLTTKSPYFSRAVQEDLQGKILAVQCLNDQSTFAVHRRAVEVSSDSCSLQEQMLRHSAELVCGSAHLNLGDSPLPREALPGCIFEYFSGHLGVVLATQTFPLDELKAADVQSRRADQLHEVPAKKPEKVGRSRFQGVRVSVDVARVISASQPFEVRLSWDCVDECISHEEAKRSLEGSVLHIRPWSCRHSSNGDHEEAETSLNFPSVSIEHRIWLRSVRSEVNSFTFPSVDKQGSYIVELLEPVALTGTLRRSRLPLATAKFDIVDPLSQGAAQTPSASQATMSADITMPWLRFATSSEPCTESPKKGLLVTQDHALGNTDSPLKVNSTPQKAEVEHEYHGSLICLPSCLRTEPLTVSVHFLTLPLTSKDELRLVDWNQCVVQRVNFEELFRWRPLIKSYHPKPIHLHTVTFLPVAEAGEYRVRFWSDTLQRELLTAKVFFTSPPPPPVTIRPIQMDSIGFTGPLLGAAARALLIGCGYKGLPHEVIGPDNDLYRMGTLLRGSFISMDRCKILSDAQEVPELHPTALNIRRELKEAKTQATAGSVFFLYYSGCGSRSELKPSQRQHAPLLAPLGPQRPLPPNLRGCALHPLDSDWGDNTLSIVELWDWTIDMKRLGVKVILLMDAGFDVTLTSAISQLQLTPKVAGNPSHIEPRRVERVWPKRQDALMALQHPVRRIARAVLPVAGLRRSYETLAKGTETQNSAGGGMIGDEVASPGASLWLVPDSPVFEASGILTGQSRGLCSLAFCETLRHFLTHETETMVRQPRILDDPLLLEAVNCNLALLAPQHGEVKSYYI